MNTLVEVLLALAGVISIYAVGVAIGSFWAIKKKRYEAYRQKTLDFDRLDQEVKEAFEKHK